jgi:hypothetical protein
MRGLSPAPSAEKSREPAGNGRRSNGGVHFALDAVEEAEYAMYARAAAAALGA